MLPRVALDAEADARYPLLAAALKHGGLRLTTLLRLLVTRHQLEFSTGDSSTSLPGGRGGARVH